MARKGFQSLHENSRHLLVVYFPVGDPEVPVDLLDVYVHGGVDVVEFGWPARNPYLDGPDVCASMRRALHGNSEATLHDALARLAGIAAAPKSLLMTYAEANHPALGDAAFFRGLDAILIVAQSSDPLRAELEARAREARVAIAAFVPLPFDDENREAARRADFYVMLQAARGVTGPRSTLDDDNGERIAELRRAGVAAPILLGFGISNGAQARKAVQLGADGIVVGSAALRAARQGRNALVALLKSLRDGLDG